MKRALFETVKVTPYASNETVDRFGYLSAVLGVSATTGGELAVTVTHADAADGTFEPVADERIISYGPEAAVEAGTPVMVGIDLIGCKQFVKIAVSGVTATYALALGDAAEAPVEG